MFIYVNVWNASQSLCIIEWRVFTSYAMAISSQDPWLIFVNKYCLLKKYNQIKLECMVCDTPVSNVPTESGDAMSLPMCRLYACIIVCATFTT